MASRSTAINLPDIRASPNHSVNYSLPATDSETFMKNHGFSEKKEAPRRREKRKVVTRKFNPAESDSSEETGESSSDSESKASGKYDPGKS